MFWNTYLDKEIEIRKIINSKKGVNRFLLVSSLFLKDVVKKMMMDVGLYILQNIRRESSSQKITPNGSLKKTT